MMREVYLHGAPGRELGRSFKLDVATPAEAVRALLMLRPKLRQILRAGAWRVIVGPPHVANGIGVDQLGMQLGTQPLHLVPATRPRGGDGQGKQFGMILLGVVLIGASIISAGALAPGAVGFLGAMSAPLGFLGLTYTNVALLGVSMIFTGLSGLMSQSPPEQVSPTDRARPEDRPSFLFQQVTNNSQQGGPVPLVYGRHLVGSVVGSAAIVVEDIAV